MATDKLSVLPDSNNSQENLRYYEAQMCTSVLWLKKELGKFSRKRIPEVLEILKKV